MADQRSDRQPKDERRKDKWDALFPWLENELGGRITAQERQVRESGGRPAWFLTLALAGGGEQRVYVRGDRGGGGGVNETYTLAREEAVIRVLFDAGIRVPEIVASCTAPKAIVMAHVDGEGHFHKVRGEAREKIAEDFLVELGRVHALDVTPFEEAGLFRPRTPEEHALSDIEIWYATYEKYAREPVPICTFAMQWMRRNVPAVAERTVLVQGDTGPGQFLYDTERARLTAIVDWEFANLGDPMCDLAHIRARDFYDPFDDLAGRFACYSRHSGVPLDLAKIRFYSVKAMLTTPLALAPVVQSLHPRSDHAEWLAQDVVYRRAASDVLCEAVGVAPEVGPLPAERSGEHSHLYDILVDNLEHELLPAAESTGVRYHRGRAQLVLRLARHLRLLERYGSEIDALELDDLGGLLGRRPASRREGMIELDDFVRRAGPECDAELARYFHRSCARDEFLYTGVLGMGEGARISPID